MSKLNQVVLLLYVLACRNLTVESRANLTNNGYTGVLIAIEPGVPESPQLIDAIQRMMTEASEYLFNATQQRAYFKEVTILIPKNWSRGTYAKPQKETYTSADIRVGPPNPNLGNNPYAWTFGDCGEGGEYIHLTPEYVTMDDISDKYGPRDRTVVHEWGRFRWGVFDEYPTSQNEKFYTNSNGVQTTIRYTGAIKDKIQNVLTGKDTEKRQLDPNYLFDEDDNQPSGLVASFCHDEETGPDESNIHNVEAPNNQNLRCDHRSTWDVILESDDFKTGVNPPNPAITNTIPEFKVVRVESKRLVIVMDVSGSMVGWKLERLRSSATQLILNLVSDEIYVGLVAFESVSYVLACPIQLRSTERRKSLIDALPSSGDGGTGIGLGIRTGIRALQSGEQSQEGGNIIVITDGEETEDPRVADIADEVVSSGVTVHAIFIGLENIDQDASLVELCEKTSGTWSYVDDTIEIGSQLNNVLASLSQDDDGDLSNDLIQMSNKVESIASGSTLQFSTAIDGSVGAHTTFTFTWSKYAVPIVEIKPPGRNCIFSNFVDKPERTYCLENPIHEVYNAVKSLIFSIPGTAEAGRWQYNISSRRDTTVTASVVSAPSGEDPITVTPRLKTTSVRGNQAAVVVAEVFQKYLPVLGATVTARVVRPLGDDFEMALLDNGAGADVRKNDGVYSKYFSAFTGQGRYFVEVFVSKTDDGTDDSSASSSSESLIKDPSNGIIKSKIIGANITGDLERVASSPGLQYIGDVSAGDIFPPNKITDLSVCQVKLDNASEGVILAFTAPGDDFDYGKATSYEIRYTFGNVTSLLKNFSAQLKVNESFVINDSLSSPKSALSKEIFILNLTDIPDEDSVRIVFAVRAYDEVDNPSKISNIVGINFFNKPPLIPEEDKDNRTLIYALAGGGAAHNRVLIYALAGGGSALLLAVIIIIVVYCRRSKYAGRVGKSARRNIRYNAPVHP